MTDWVEIFQVLGTFVLAGILIQQSYATWQERKDKRMEREREQRETPRFVLAGKLAFDPETITIAKPKVGIKKYHIRVLKAPLTNKGETMAHNAKAHVAIASSELAWPTVWTTHGSYQDEQIILPAPEILGDSIDNIRAFIEVGYFGNPYWVNNWERDITHETTQVAVILYTIEGSEFAYSISSAIKPMKLPLETTMGVSVGMANAKSSQTRLVKFRISSWDKFEEL